MTTDTVHFGILGAHATIAAKHLDAIAAAGGAVTAYFDPGPEPPGFTGVPGTRCRDLGELLRTAPDVIAVLSPSNRHADDVEACLRAEADVVVEKPLALDIGRAADLIRLADRLNRRLVVCLQHRFRESVQTVRDLVRSGELGSVQTVRLLVCEPRTAAYYTGRRWRGTWAGEGGGVLMNQAPHYVDLLTDVFGLPSSVVARRRRQQHTIQTEDTIDCLIDWPSGCVGSLHISTAERGPAELLEVIGTGGWITLSGTQVTVHRFATAFDRYLAEPDPFAVSAARTEPRVLDGAGGHRAIYQELLRIRRTGERSRIEAVHCLDGLHLANAITLSGLDDVHVELPIDAAGYAERLAVLMTGERAEQTAP
ncbi:Gfo/Idh/MocA family oxidoreductase [Kribbella sp. NPDC023972]|uniref:Gfo/Idh/MocA family protein n=1 Tax=Kribbella sp. NPDC023972 TaxID=3154795 RepID=UPI0033CA8414